MPKLAEKLRKCFKEGEKGEENHKGLMKIKPNENLKSAHLEKALHNFKAINVFYKEGFSDWSASAAFYCLYHCLLGILSKHGYESRNQSCTLALVEDMINKGKVTELTKEDLKEIFDIDFTKALERSTKILNIREDMQYSTKTSMQDDAFTALKERTKNSLEKLRRELEK